MVSVLRDYRRSQRNYGFPCRETRKILSSVRLCLCGVRSICTPWTVPYMYCLEVGSRMVWRFVLHESLKKLYTRQRAVRTLVCALYTLYGPVRTAHSGCTTAYS